MYRHSLILLVATVVFLAMPAISQELTEQGVDSDTPVIVPQQISGAMTWEINVPSEQVFLRVVGSNGEVYSKRFIATQKPHYDFLDMNGAPLPDGEYSYEIVARRALSPSESSALAQAAKTAASAWEAAARAHRSSFGLDGRTEEADAEVRELERIAMEADRDLRELRERLRRQNGPFAFTASERFDVRRGTVEFRETRQRSEVENTVAAPGPDAGTMDTTDAGDIKAGSGLAAGDTSLSPGDGHLWLYSTSPKITLTDPDDGTAKSWDISASADSFNIISQNGTAPIRIEALSTGAPISSFYIDSLGRVGLGTGAPATNLEISDFRPTLRLTDLTDGSHSVLSQDEGEFHIWGDNDQIIVRVDGNALTDSLKIDTHGDLEARGINIVDPLPQLTLEDLDSKTWNIQVGAFGELQLQSVSNSNAVPLRVFSSAPTDSLSIESDGSVNISAGTETNPSLILGDDEDTGFYLDDPDVVALSAGGVQRFRVTAAGTNIFDGRLAAQSGSLGFPGFTFINDSDTGMMNPVQGALGWPVDGTLKMYLNSSGLQVFGNLTKSSGSFKIDHPLDPANKYLYHSFVESPDMMNIYNGNVTLDEEGRATVVLPEWFEALNGDYRYQLTPIGKTDDVLYIEREIEENSFVIAGGEPGTRVSWLVTGVRIDPYAVANRIRVEENKPLAERGTFLFPGYYESQEKTASKESHSPLENDARESGAIHSLELENHELKTKNRELERALQRLTARVAALESMMVGSVPAEAASTD